MITEDIYGKTLSSSFNTAISAYSQTVKPKILIDLLDSRHLSNVSITNSDAHTVTSEGSLGFYFKEKQAVNGYERESYAWAVADAKQKDGTVIKADGNFYSIPADDKDDYEFGWWTKTKSQANGVFASSPTLSMTFNTTKMNKIRISTSESLGQIQTFTVRVYGQSPGFILLLDKTVTLLEDEYFKELDIQTDNAINANYQAGKIELILISTKNGLDYGRIHEINPIYQIDATDYVIDYTVSRARDVHESTLPIAGTQSPKITIKFDNANKDWNAFNESTGFGKYMKKDIKIKIGTGWRIKKTNDVLSNTLLKTSISNSANTLSVLDAAIFPTGGSGNNFLITIDPDNSFKEMILCSNSVISTNTLNLSERGYSYTDAVAHSAGAKVQFDPYEYVDMGTFYVDEWTSSSSEMTTSVTASDWTKFMSEKKLTKGFFLENSTVGNAVKNLLLKTNFPKADFKQVSPYAKDAVSRGAVLQYSFNDDAVDKDNNIVRAETGLRCRFWGMSPGKERFYKNIVADALERTLSVEDRVNGEKGIISPSFTTNSKDISSGDDALGLNNFTFTGVNNSVTYDKYYNGVVDGYYIPLYSGDQDLLIQIISGGVRVYLDNTLIIESWKDHSTQTLLSSYAYRKKQNGGVANPLNLIAGTPYKLRIEFFHGPGIADFDIRLFKNFTALDNPTVNMIAVPLTDTRTVSALDGAGYRDGSIYANVAGTNHHNNDGIYNGNIALNKGNALTSDENNMGILLYGNGYIRVPNHSSIAISEADFTIEFIAKFHNSYFSNDGEYISSWGNSNPSSGYEFYFNGNSSHGIKIKTTSGTVFANGNANLSTANFYHVAATYKKSTKIMSYYVNGQLQSSVTLTGNIVTQASDLTIGGRGSSFTAGTGAVMPATPRDITMDEFAIYNKSLTSKEITERYISSNVSKIHVFPFLYSEDETIRSAIDKITLADLGRFYIDENNIARYEHYNRFYEPSIDQHANVQYTINDSSDIISSDIQVQMQANKVTVKTSGVSTIDTKLQGLWNAQEGSTLALVKSVGTLLSNATQVSVTTTTDPVFSNTGYLAMSKTIDSVKTTEIIKYNAKNGSTFLNLERGLYNTTPLEFETDTKVREVRVYEITYDKKPAFNINPPFITAINDERPALIDVLKFEPSAYTCILILAASEDVPDKTFAYVQGTNKLTERQYASSISGTAIIATTSGEQVKEESASLSENIRKYGLKEITIDSEFITDIEHAKSLAQFIIDKMSDPVPIINAQIMSVPTIQLGDRIVIGSLDSFDISGSSTKDNNGDYNSIAGHYWVVSQDFGYGQNITHSLTLRKVT